MKIISLVLLSGFIIGLGFATISFNSFSTHAAFSQDRTDLTLPKSKLIRGHGRAISSQTPPGEKFTLIASDSSRVSFTTIPNAKSFILTDIVYHTQGSVVQPLTVNIADADPVTGKQSILVQVHLGPGQSEDIHFCTGYVIPAGHAVSAFTNAGLEREQYVSISITGYLVDE
jgi:hypothetical protein